MKVHELKNLIKPMIKELLKEVLVEEGFMKILAESKQAPVQATPSPVKHNPNPAQAPKPQLQEAKKKLLDAIGQGGFDAFAGTEPLRGTDSQTEMAETKNSDPGIDISKLLGENKQIWSKTLDAMSNKK